AIAASNVARSRPSTVTVAPARARLDAIGRPIPRPPPVTRAWEERGRPDMRSSSCALHCSDTCVYFRLQAFATNAATPAALRCPGEQQTGSKTAFLQMKIIAFHTLKAC